MSDRQEIARARRWVVKVGSALLTNDGRGLDEAMITGLVGQLAALRESGSEVVLVSSGAVAAGLVRLGWPPFSPLPSARCPLSLRPVVHRVLRRSGVLLKPAAAPQRLPPLHPRGSRFLPNKYCFRD